MNLEQDLLFALLALRAGLLTREEFLRCPDLRQARPSARLSDLLVEEGLLNPLERQALDALCSVYVARYGRGTVAADLSRLGSDADIRGYLGRAFAGTGETVLDWRPSEEEPAAPADTVAGPPCEDEPSAPGATAPEEVSGEAVRFPLARGRPDRYAFLGELGRGALGRVVEAVDRDFGRTVAVKMMLPGRRDPDGEERFLQEGRVAGKLPHPNIVPVFEIGRLEGEGEPAPFFTMAKIEGTDLAAILARRRREGPGRFTRGRLLRVFQEVCHAVSFAHDRGVVHRDLKPANIMVGDYGEVFVVDWGLAKVRGPRPGKLGPLTRMYESMRSSRPDLTCEGQILGTPAYMSPEQARGETDRVDERSDIYCLGAILYHIVAGRPPYEGRSAREVIGKVLSGAPPPPSRTAAELAGPPEGASAGPDAGDPEPGQDREEDRRLPPTGRGDRPDVPDEPVPAALDAIVGRAMAPRPQDRHASARDLAEEVEAFLDGEKERARLHEAALAKLDQGLDSVRKLENLRAACEETRRAAVEEERRIRPHDPLEKKRGLARKERELARLRRSMTRAFGEATAALQEALGFERGNARVRRALADLYWKRSGEEEAEGRTESALYFESLVREYDDGTLAEALRGRASFSVRARAYPCDCLRSPRQVSPEEIEAFCRPGTDDPDAPPPGVLGYHPLSGRRLLGAPEGARGCPEFEPSGPLRLRVHAASCRAEPLRGARAWLLAWEEDDLVRRPAPPREVEGAAGAVEALPGAVRDACFPPGTPCRPERGLLLGRTPLDGLSAPAGSYLLLLEKEGFAPQRVPFRLGRQESAELNPVLYAEDEVPPGFLPVTAGPFLYQGDPRNPNSRPPSHPAPADFFAARLPVTCEAYAAFLSDEARDDPEAAAARAPRAQPGEGFFWPRAPDGSFSVPTAAWLETAPEAERKAARRLTQAPADWEEGWPVYGVSWLDALAFARRATLRTGWLTTLPHEVLWEKMARGADGRFYPWGDRHDDVLYNGLRRLAGAPRPGPAGTLPFDESPYGLRDLAGNAGEWCLNDVEEGRRRCLRGASWLSYGYNVRASFRSAFDPRLVSRMYGFRLAVLPSLGPLAPPGSGPWPGPGS